MHQNKRKRGRPLLPKGEKRDRRLTVNLTAAEHRELAKAAGEESLSDLFRRLALRWLARRK